MGLSSTLSESPLWVVFPPSAYYSERLVLQRTRRLNVQRIGHRHANTFDIRATGVLRYPTVGWYSPTGKLRPMPVIRANVRCHVKRD